MVFVVLPTGLWGLVNNAGVNSIVPFDWLTTEEIKFVFDVNAMGPVNVTKAMLPLLKKGRGRIVNVASTAGRICLPYFSAYAMSKHAVEAFSDCLRMEMMPFKVSVHVIEPSACRTNMTEKNVLFGYFKKHWDQIDKGTREEYGETFLRESK